ncbi:SCO6745 family protein [Geodermatophilus sp. SYSU D01036]
MVTADQPVLDPALVGRAHRAVEPLHNHVYFVPETEQHLTAIGLRPGRMVYFAGRAAPMGAVGPGVVTATFSNFSPAIVARHIPRAWTLASPAQVVEARFASARASLTRLLGGEEAAAAPEVTELGDLLADACSVLPAEGRPLYAGHADLPWPEDPVTRLWHAASLLREWRGDGHVAVLLRHGLSGLEALVTHTATGRGFLPASAKATRGWSDEDWAAAAARLADRGLLDGDRLTDAGQRLRADLEAETDALGTTPWAHLGPERTARVVELGKRMSATLVANGAYPSGVFAGR